MLVITYEWSLWINYNPINTNKGNKAMDIQVNNAHLLTLTYSGYGKFTVTWKGFPSEGSRTVRRTIHADSAYNFEPAAIEAAKLFMEWQVETTPMGGTRNWFCKSITMGELTADKRAVLVQTDCTD